MKGLNAGASGLRDSNPHPIVESELMPTGQRAANLLEAATSVGCRFLGSSRQAMRLTVYGRYTDFGLRSLGLNVRFGS